MAALGILGGGRFAELIADLADAIGHFDSIHMFDDSLKGRKPGVSGSLDEVDSFIERGQIDSLAIGIGYRHFSVRQALFEKYFRKIDFPPLIHPSAVVSPKARIGPGCLIFSMVNVEVHAHLESNVAVFNNSSVTHEVEIGAHSFLSVGVAMGGGVKIGSRTFIGVNATIVNDINIGNDCVVCAGTFLTDSISDAASVVGNPFRQISRPQIV